MSGPRDVRLGQNGSGQFAIQFRISKDDPIAPYVIAAMEKAAHTVKDPVTGFTEIRDGDRDAADEVVDMLLKMLPEDLQNRFAQETVADRERAKEQIEDAVGGLGIGTLFAALGGMGKFSKQAASKGLNGPIKSVVGSFPDVGDDLNRIVRPDTPNGKRFMASLGDREEQ